MFKISFIIHNFIVVFTWIYQYFCHWYFMVYFSNLFMLHSVLGMSFVSKNILQCRLIIFDFLKLHLIFYFCFIYSYILTYFNILFHVSYLLSVFLTFILLFLNLVILIKISMLFFYSLKNLFKVTQLVWQHGNGWTMSDLNSAFSHLMTR